MNREFLNKLKAYSTEPFKVDRLIISLFIKENGIKVRHNQLLKRHQIRPKDEMEHSAFLDFEKSLKRNHKEFGFEELIEIFEFVISPADRVVNGAVYTPGYIKDYIVSETLKKLEEKGISLATATFGDIACGCGGFFYTLANTLKERTGKSFADIYKENLFGLDIQLFSIQRTELLLSLLALQNGEDAKEFEFNLYVGDALDFDWFSKCQAIERGNGFSAIVGNPPYVSTRNIELSTLNLLSNWEVAKSGHPDLYILFFEIGLKFIQAGGVLGFITMNTFLKSMNGRALRSFFAENKFELEIIDFHGEQVFKSRSTYTCICLVTNERTGRIRYVKVASSNISNLSSKDFEETPYSVLNHKKGWQLTTRKLIEHIENVGKPLGAMFQIRNGFATLKNDVFVFIPTGEKKHCYSMEKDGKEYLIEKAICRTAIKPNTLKHEKDIPESTEQLIFPYIVEKRQGELFESFSSSNNFVRLFGETYFQKKYPKAYKYLSDYRSVLAERDKGKGENDYKEWYAFGRNQALTISGYKLLFPYICDEPRFIFSEDFDLLFYNGYAIVSEDKESLLAVQKILNSKVFEFYIKNYSKPYSSNYYSLSKSYIQNFGVPQLDDEFKEILLNGHTKDEIDEILMEKYELMQKF